MLKLFFYQLNILIFNIFLKYLKFILLILLLYLLIFDDYSNIQEFFSKLSHTISYYIIDQILTLILIKYIELMSESIIK